MRKINLNIYIQVKKKLEEEKKIPKTLIIQCIESFD